MGEKRTCNSCQKEFDNFRSSDTCNSCGNEAIYQSTFCLSCYTHDIKINHVNLLRTLESELKNDVAARRLYIFLAGLVLASLFWITPPFFIWSLLIWGFIFIINERFVHYHRITRINVWIMNNFTGDIFR